MRVVSKIAFVSSTVMLFAAAMTPASAGSGSRTAVGFGIGAVVGAILATEAARAARPSERAARPRTQTRPTASSGGSGSGSGNVHQIDQKSTSGASGRPSKSPSSSDDPFMGAQPDQARQGRTD